MFEPLQNDYVGRYYPKKPVAQRGNCDQIWLRSALEQNCRFGPRACFHSLFGPNTMAKNNGPPICGARTPFVSRGEGNFYLEETADFWNFDIGFGFFNIVCNNFVNK